MMLNKTVHQIYKEKTGHTAWLSAGEDEHALSLYVEGPTRLYIAWLERCAAEEHGVAALQTTNSSSHEMPSFEDVYTEWSGVNTHLAPKTDRERIIAHDIYNIIAQHFGH